MLTLTLSDGPNQQLLTPCMLEGILASCTEQKNVTCEHLI